MPSNRSHWAFFFFIFLASAWATCHAESSQEKVQKSPSIQKLISEALSSKGYTLKDLQYKKDLVEDPNVSPLVKSILSNPTFSFEVVDRFSKRLRVEPWQIDNAVPGSRRCRVFDWKNVPSELRPHIQILLNRLLYAKSQVSDWFESVDLEEKNNALRYFTLENFHPDLDKNSLRFWGERSGGEEKLRELLQRSDDLKMSETESIETQLSAGSNLNPVTMSQVSSSVALSVHEFVENVKILNKYQSKKWEFETILLQTELGPVVIGGVGSQTYRNPEALIIDLGGDDHYEFAGCAYGTVDQIFSVAIDISGNDTYRNAGAGVWGFGFLWDESGNDVYRSDNGSIGCGVFGAGIVIDIAGNDRYIADTLAEGAAAFGYGLLWDGKGDDRYSVSLQGQGFAGVNGYGVLCDFDGDDLYKAMGKYPDYDRLPDHTVSLSQGFSIGYRPYAPGGVGILYDRKGNDEYRSDIFGQGASYWYSCGMLIDEEGNDQYFSGQYDQGTGIHLSVGILKDSSGDDQYISSSGLAQGSSHDLSVGLLWDLKGNDFYSARSASQGSGIFNGVGMLVDEKGNDRYRITKPKETNGQGMGLYSEPRGFGSVGLLFDLQGHDTYSNVQSNNQIVERQDFGIAVDREPKKQFNANDAEDTMDPDLDFRDVSLEFGHFVTDEIALRPRSRSEIIDHGGDAHLGDLLIHAARSGDFPWKVRDRKQAHDALTEVPIEAYDEIFPWLGLSDSMVKNEIENQLNQKDKAGLQVLREFVLDDWYEIRIFCLRLLEQKGSQADVALAVKSLKNKKTRVSALLLIAKFGAGEFSSKVRPYLHAERGVERALALRILSKNEEQLSTNQIIDSLEDSDWNVRRQAVKALESRGQSAKDLLEERLPSLSPLGQYWAAKMK